MRIALILLISVVLFSCRKKTAVPKDVLPVPKMTEVMWDMMLADQLVNMRYGVDTAHRRFDTSVIMYQQIMQLHHTSQGEFKKSLQFYEGRPDLLQIIVDTLQARAQKPLPADTTGTLKPQ